MATVQTLKAEKTVEHIVDIIVDKKGEDITVIDLRGISSISDYFVIATGSSNVHIKAIADEVHIKMKNDHQSLPYHVEGFQSSKWILLDYADVVVHFFDNHTRHYYDLEKLWEDAKISKIDPDLL